MPIEGLGTSDQYAIGDLSGKYGTLQQKENEKISTVDFNLPLFGAHSIVGRALVFYSHNGSTVACSNLDLFESDMTVAFATFDRPVQGQVILKQRKHNCTDDTYVYFEISRSAENSTNSFAHEWSIRRNPIFTGNAVTILHKQITCYTSTQTTAGALRSVARRIPFSTPTTKAWTRCTLETATLAM